PTPKLGADDIRLPSMLNATEGADVAVARFRLLAVEQAERLTRGTAGETPHADALERDLYLLREGAAIDARIARVMPRLQGALAEERRAALVRRPHFDGLTPQKRKVERLLRHVLKTEPNAADVVSEGPGESLAWAKDMAASIRRERGRYRGIPPAGAWGEGRRPANNSRHSGSPPVERR